jgi:hypothetical protein
MIGVPQFVQSEKETERSRGIVRQGNEDTVYEETPCFQGVCYDLMGDEGFEPPTSTV